MRKGGCHRVHFTQWSQIHLRLVFDPEPVGNRILLIINEHSFTDMILVESVSEELECLGMRGTQVSIRQRIPGHTRNNVSVIDYVKGLHPL